MGFFNITYSFRTRYNRQRLVGVNFLTGGTFNVTFFTMYFKPTSQELMCKIFPNCTFYIRIFAITAYEKQAICHFILVADDLIYKFKKKFWWLKYTWIEMKPILILKNIKMYNALLQKSTWHITLKFIKIWLTSSYVTCKESIFRRINFV